MSGSFWKFSNGFTSLSNISTLLENYSINNESADPQYSSTKTVLMKLLDENDLLQELLSNNSMLLEFLREDDVLSILVELVHKEGNLETDVTSKLDSLQLDNEDGTSGNTSDAESKEETDEKAPSKEIDSDNENSVENEKSEDAEAENEDEETPEERANRHATLAAEILSADVWSLTDAVMESTSNLNKLWEVLDAKEPLSINLSTYFMKIMEHLLDMKCDEMVTYLIENQPNLVEKFMNHLSNPPLMDFLLKLISTDKPDNSTGIIDFLQSQDLISHLIEELDIGNEDEKSEDYNILLVRQSSAADFLKALITISANSTTDNSTIGPNELTRELVSYKKMTRVCDIMLKGGHGLANAVGMIIEIIRKNNSDYDILPVLYITLESHPPTGRDPIYLGHLLEVFGSKIEDFNRLLVENFNREEKLLTPFGEIEPLGYERFKICELIAELLHCSNMALLNDNKGYDIVRERDQLRNRMKEYDPVSFKYNEVIVLPDMETNNDDDYANDTIDSFNGKIRNVSETMIQQPDDEDEPHANANLTEEQIRANPVIGDYLKIALYDNQIITNILTMFFRFPWNNFLHNVVFDVVQQILNGSMDIGFNKFLAINLFSSGDITTKIIEGQKLCTAYEEENNGLRLGYMGHLTLIAEEVVKFIQLFPVNTLSDLIDEKVDDEVWEEYVSNVLYDTREKYNAILGGGDDDDENEDENSNTFDESAGEIIDESEFKSSLALDPSVDNDILGSGYEEGDSNKNGDNESHEISSRAQLHKSNYSDESESEDDDDHFSNYMSQQLTNTASTEIGSNLDNSKGLTNKPFKDFSSQEIHSDLDGDEDYIDPNDDGLSYKKSHPLYDAEGSLLTDANHEDVISSEDSSSSSSDNDDEIIDDDDEEMNDSRSSNKLTRSASKS